MRLLLGIGLCFLIASSGEARGFGGGMGGGARGGFGGFRGGFPGRFNGFRDRFGGFRGRFTSLVGRRPGRFGRGNQSFMGNGFFGGGFGEFSDTGWGDATDFGMPAPDQTQQGPSVVVVPPSVPPEPPANPVIREYHWPNSDQDASTPYFSIVTNDRATHYATMVWSEGNLLRFTTPNGTISQIVRSSISRDLTYKANPAKNVKAWLP